MTTPRRKAWRLGIAILLLAAVVAPPAAATEPVVRAVLFFSPTCPHCHVVIDDVLPPIFEAHGGPAVVVYDESLNPVDRAFYLITNGRLEVLLADVTVPEGAMLFYAATMAFRIESQGVPRLIVADQVMIGSAEIPDRFPGVVAAALDTGASIDWPAIPDIAAAVAATDSGAPATTTTTSASTTTPTTVPTPATTSPIPSGTERASMWDTFRQDTTGNSISVIVLLGMVAALVAAAVRWRRIDGSDPGWGIPALALIGLGVAAYLAFVEVGGSEAVCGPVGDCNAVQNSEYARLFGVLPVGVAGVVGYLLVVAAWVVAHLTRTAVRDLATVAILGGAVIGTLFSIYLTFLEPFVIGATCMWCITSAVVVTTVMWLSVGPARAALGRLRPVP